MFLIISLTTSKGDFLGLSSTTTSWVFNSIVSASCCSKSFFAESIVSSTTSLELKILSAFSTFNLFLVPDNPSKVSTVTSFIVFGERISDIMFLLPLNPNFGSESCLAKSAYLWKAVILLAYSSLSFCISKALWGSVLLNEPAKSFTLFKFVSKFSICSKVRNWEEGSVLNGLFNLAADKIASVSFSRACLWISNSCNSTSTLFNFWSLATFCSWLSSNKTFKSLSFSISNCFFFSVVCFTSWTLESNCAFTSWLAVNKMLSMSIALVISTSVYPEAILLFKVFSISEENL